MLASLYRMFLNTLIIMLGAGFILLGLLGLTAGGTGAGQSAAPDAITVWSVAQPAVLAGPVEAASTSAPGTQAEAPTRLEIPAIQLDAPVVPAVEGFTKLAGRSYLSWQVPDGYLVGWHGDSARLGEPGNVVLNGHHNIYGQVFARLIDLEEGDEIWVFGEHLSFRYRVTEKVLLREKDQPRKVRLENSHWIMPTSDSRLTLVTCWPYETNTHRLIIVAEPD